MVVLIDLVAGKLAAQDFCKDVVRVVGGHGGSLKISRFQSGMKFTVSPRTLSTSAGKR
jgi:hypothetical protein